MEVTSSKLAKTARLWACWKCQKKKNHSTKWRTKFLSIVHHLTKDGHFLEHQNKFRCNSSHSKIVGIGEVCVQTDVGCTLTLKDVRHVHGLLLNLISKSACAGTECYFGNGRWKLTKGSLVVSGRRACDTLYKTCVRLCKSALNVVEDSYPNLWHRRLGHVGEKGQQSMASKGLIPYSKDTFIDPCDYCLFGKQHRSLSERHRN